MGSKRKRGRKTGAAEGQPAEKRSKQDEDKPEPSATTATSNLELDKSPYAENVTTEDRKREAKVYDLLGSADVSERIAAAEALITGLLASEQVVLERHLEKRLFRGLASSRNASRVGFSLAITEILTQLFGPSKLAKTRYSSLSFDTILGMLVERTQSGGNIPGQEERDFCYGQLFGLQCFVEAKILFGADDSRWPAVLDLLLKLADKKVWLRSQCAWVIVETLPQMGQEKALQTLKQLVDIGLAKSAEGVGIWLKAIELYPDMKPPTKPWRDPMATKSLPELANILKENVKQDDGSKDANAIATKQANWSAQLHFVWDIILSHNIRARNPDQFKAFWSAVIDDGLFSKNATDGQKFRGFSIFQKFLQGLLVEKEISMIKELFSRNLMKCLINQASKEDRYLHRAALKSLKAVEAVAEADASFLIPILQELLGKWGAYDFDKRTSTKTIEKLLQSATPAISEQLVKLLRDPAMRMKEGDAAEIERYRSVYAEYLLRLSTQSRADGKEEEAVNLELFIGELATHAYAKSDAGITPELSERAREAFRSRLSSAFAKLTKRREDYRQICMAVIALEPSAVIMSDQIKDECKSALKALRKLLKSSNKSPDVQSDSSIGLALLYAVSILQLYNGEPDALDTLHDLKQCSEKLKEGDAAVSVLLVEILLSFVSRQSSLMRQVTQQVFEAFTGQLSTEAIKGLVEHLAAEENLKGQQTLFEAEDENMEDADGSADEDENDDDEDDMSEIGSDVEFVTLNGAEIEADEDGEEKDGDDDGDDGEDDGEVHDAGKQNLAELDDALAKVLRSHRLDQDKEAESSDNDSDMTDSEMMALDAKLVEVFQQRAQKPSKKKENKSAKETVVNFKHRVLDFLDIYVKKETASPLSFGLLLPLLRLIRTTQTKTLAKKAADIITDFSKAFKKARGALGAEAGVDDVDAQLELLREIHAEAPKDESNAFAWSASNSSLLVASRLLAADKANIHKVAAVYAATQAEWTLGNVKIQPLFFLEWVKWCQAHASTA